MLRTFSRLLFFFNKAHFCRAGCILRSNKILLASVRIFYVIGKCEAISYNIKKDLHPSSLRDKSLKPLRYHPNWRNAPALKHTNICSLLVTVRVPVSTYSNSLSAYPPALFQPALTSPFTEFQYTAFTPSAALWDIFLQLLLSFIGLSLSVYSYKVYACQFELSTLFSP